MLSGVVLSAKKKEYGVLKIFIGWDKNEEIAFHVLSHSIIRHSTVPVSIIPIKKEHFPFFKRERGKYDSTDFSITRFLVPYLCDYEGHAVFMDCDMLVTANVVELLAYAVSMRTEAVLVAKHDYVPKTEKKFLNQKQTVYGKKNWSSVMVFNNENCTMLTPEYVETADGLDLHQFKWLPDHAVGSLPLEWNWLVGEYGPQHAKNYHYTLGTPCFSEYRDCEYSELWHKEHKLMNALGE